MTNVILNVSLCIQEIDFIAINWELFGTAHSYCERHGLIRLKKHESETLNTNVQQSYCLICYLNDPFAICFIGKM